MVDAEVCTETERSLRGYLELDHSGTHTSMYAYFADFSGVGEGALLPNPLTGDLAGCSFVLRSGGDLPRQLGAGDLTWRSGDDEVTISPTAAQPDTGTAAEAVSYANQSLEDHGFSPQYGSGYGVSASGGDFPAFAIPSAVTFPEAALQLLHPVTKNGASPEVDVSEDLEVRWVAGSGADQVWVTLFGTAGGEYVDLRCESPDDGTFVFPSSLLSQLDPYGTTVEVIRFRERCHEQNDAWLRVRAKVRSRGKFVPVQSSG